MYDNCYLTMYVEGFKDRLKVKTGKGKFELIVNIVDSKVHILSPNMEYDVVHESYAKAIQDLMVFNNQYSVMKWWYSKTVDEEKIKRQLATAFK